MHLALYKEVGRKRLFKVKKIGGQGLLHESLMSDAKKAATCINTLPVRNKGNFHFDVSAHLIERLHSHVKMSCQYS